MWKLGRMQRRSFAIKQPYEAKPSQSLGPPAPTSNPNKTGTSSLADTATKIQPRFVLLAISITIIAATGAWFGADLKANREVQREAQQIQQASFDERISQLESTKSVLEQRKSTLDAKIAGLRARAAAQEEADAKRDKADLGSGG